jgi:hypothetical protein
VLSLNDKHKGVHSMKPKDVYQTVKELSEPFIQHYHDDLLKHDKKSIEENIENTPFIHFTGTMGTHLFFLEPANNYPIGIVPFLFGHADRNHILEQVESSIKWCRKSNRQALILYYDGTRISKINQDIAESLAEEYVAKIKKEWLVK